MDIIPGYITTQKVITVANNDIAMNAEITTQNNDGWLVVSLTLSGANVIILLQKIVPAALS